MSRPDDQNISTEPHIESLWRYPVKGLMGEELQNVEVEEQSCFPYDRKYAIENGPSPFDPKAPKFLPKINFLMLMRNERLSLLTTKFEEETETLTILRQDRPVASGDLRSAIGRNMIEQFIAAFMSEELKGPPRIQSAPNHHFTDTDARYVHIINRASVTALGHMVNGALNPKRFRANIVLAGLEPWAEKQWVGKKLQAGPVEIEIKEETNRCAAINVDPETAKRDQSLPAILNQQFGNDNFGIYGEIKQGGTLEKGARFTVKSS